MPRPLWILPRVSYLGYGLYQYIAPLIVTLFPSLNSDRLLYLNFLHWICPDYWIYLDYNIWLFLWLSHFPWFFDRLPHLSDLPWFLLHHQSLRRGHLFCFGFHLDYCIQWAFPQGVLHCWVYRHWLLRLALIYKSLIITMLHRSIKQLLYSMLWRS